MELSPDELAGVADLFGGLTRAELLDACVELAFKAGEDRESEAFEDSVAAAVDTYHLVAVEREQGSPLLVPGPVAFPELPEGATDLPHILDVAERPVDADAKAAAAEARFRADAAAAVEASDAARIERLLDVSYELDVWAPVDLAATRDRLDRALEDA